MPLYNPDEGQYSLPITPQSGDSYEIKVTAPGFPSAQAQTRIPLRVEQSIDYQAVVTDEPLQGCASGVCNPYVTHYLLEVTLTDPAHQKNYYEAAGLIRYFDEQLVYDTDIFEPDTLIDTIDYRIWLTTDDPFFFTGGETDEEIQREKLAFSDRLFEGKAQTIRYRMDHRERQTYQLLVLLKTLHPTLYRYQEERDRQTGFSSSPFIEPQPVPHNIEGGYGIFSSYSEDTVFIDVEPPGG